MPLVAGVDSSTQACKVVVRDAESGRLVRHGRAAHPPGTEVDPELWWRALQRATLEAGGLDDVAALSIAGQQHGLICLDHDGHVVRDALLWNDTRSADAASSLTSELAPADWVARVGSLPVASLTISKLRWLAEHEPANADRTAAVCLPHDWLTWRLRPRLGIDQLTTDRSDASGTGYFDCVSNTYCADLVQLAFGRDDVQLPRVVGPHSPCGEARGALLGPGVGDNAAAHLGLDAGTDMVVSLGTSGVVMTRHHEQTHDLTGLVTGFADASDAYLPLACTLNAARVLDATARVLSVSLAQLSSLAHSAPAGAEGVVVVPYFEGERTPNRPDATAAIHGLTLSNATAPNIARAAVEGILCGLTAGLRAMTDQGIPVSRVILIGGAAASPAVREIAPTIFGVPVVAPAPGEYVADGAARQAAWTLAGSHQPPTWGLDTAFERFEAPLRVDVLERYREAATHYLDRRSAY